MTSSYRGTQKLLMKLRAKEREPIEHHLSYIITLWKEDYEIQYQGSEAHKAQDLRRHPRHVVWTLSFHQVRDSGLKLPRTRPKGPEMSSEFCHLVSEHCPREILPPPLTSIL